MQMSDQQLHVSLLWQDCKNNNKHVYNNDKNVGSKYPIIINKCSVIKVLAT